MKSIVTSIDDDEHFTIGLKESNWLTMYVLLSFIGYSLAFRTKKPRDSMQQGILYPYQSSGRRLKKLNDKERYRKRKKEQKEKKELP